MLASLPWLALPTLSIQHSTAPTYKPQLLDWNRWLPHTLSFLSFGLPLRSCFPISNDIVKFSSAFLYSCHQRRRVGLNNRRKLNSQFTTSDVTFSTHSERLIRVSQVVTNCPQFIIHRRRSLGPFLSQLVELHRFAVVAQRVIRTAQRPIQTNNPASMLWLLYKTNIKLGHRQKGHRKLGQRSLGHQ